MPERSVEMHPLLQDHKPSCDDTDPKRQNSTSLACSDWSGNE